MNVHNVNNNIRIRKIPKFVLYKLKIIDICIKTNIY